MLKNTYDLLIVGGSYAGLSAAMALGRALRKVLIVDSGQPCNHYTPHSHNFITQDGSPPAAIAEKARKELLAYPTVQLWQDTVNHIEGTDNHFVALTPTGKTIKARKILFTTGITDVLPPLPGFAECWGISVIHCPYCHGYEYRNQTTGILMNGTPAFEFAKMIRNWTDKLHIFSNGNTGLTNEQLASLEKKAIQVEPNKIKAILHNQGKIRGILFENGAQVPLEALYARLPFEQSSTLPKKLGCAFNEMGYITTDDWKRTNIPGIYAAGDCTSPLRSVANAVGAGSSAGAFINHDLVTQDWDTEEPLNHIL